MRDTLNPKLDPKWKMAALLHDAAEYVIGDLISPVKNNVGKEYSLLEERLMFAIYQRFGILGKIPKTIQQKIKSADKYSAWLEAVKIAGFTKAEANKIFGQPKIQTFNKVQIVPMPPLTAKALFLKKYGELIKVMELVTW